MNTTHLNAALDRAVWAEKNNLIGTPIMVSRREYAAIRTHMMFEYFQDISSPEEVRILGYKIEVI